MTLPSYNEEKALENLCTTIEAILRYNRTVFKTGRLAKTCGRKDGHFFGAHVKHLVEAGYLSREKAETCIYSVTNWEDLKRYKDFISLLLSPSEDMKKELLEIRQI